MKKQQPSLHLNMVANYAGKFWSIASIYIFVPYYIRILGMDAYGLIAFNAIMLALLFVADAGLSSSFAREAAKGQRGQELLDTLVSIERVLFTILTLTGVAFAALAPVISEHWLKSVHGLDRDVVVRSLQIMPFAIVPQIAMALYSGGLMGLERQVKANLILTIFTIIRSGFVIFPIYLWPDIRVFFVWQAIASIVMMLCIREVLLRQIAIGENYSTAVAHRLKGRFSIEAIQRIRSYALGMLGMSFIAGLNTQLDKLVVSKMLPLAVFAQYSLASSLTLIPFILTLPIAMALLPRFTSQLELNRNSELTDLYRSSTYYIASIGAISGIAICLFVGDVMGIWLHGQNIDHSVIFAARTLALGSMFLAFQLTSYQLSLAHGHNATNFRLGVVMFCVSIPLQIYLTSRFGVRGAAVPWLLINALAFIYLGVVLNLRFSVISLTKYFMVDNLLGVMLAMPILGFARLLTIIFDMSHLTSCITASIASSATFGLAHVVQLNIKAAERGHVKR